MGLEREKDLARELQSRRDDDSEWEEEAEEAVIARPASVVYSVRFAPEELEEIRRVAAEIGITPSEFIRTSASEKMHQVTSAKIYTSAVRLVQWYTKSLSSNTVDTAGAPQEPRIEPETVRLAETA